jgi:aspartate/methionine/tyrosine aminotransferase
MQSIAESLAPFGTSIFAEMTQLANAHGAINLAQGFPDFDGPDFIKRIAAEAMERHGNQYAPPTGILPLRRAIADRWQRKTGRAPDLHTEVTVTSGCTEAIAASVIGLLNPGDEIILFEPFFDTYPQVAARAGAVARYVTMRPDATGRFTFDPDELRRAVTQRTRAMLVNTPHNPTGTVLTRDELGIIADLCIEHDLVAISDEVYEDLVFDGEHLHLATWPGMWERTITMSSIGKTFSLTGWKIGWAIAPPPLTAAVRAAHQLFTFASATPLQYGAAAALDVDDSYYESFVEAYRARRDFLAGVLVQLGFRLRPPEGTYFILADHRVLDAGDDRAACRHLIERCGVATIPPSAFYDHPEEGRNLLRFAFCKRMSVLEEAAARLATLSRPVG